MEIKWFFQHPNYQLGDFIMMTPGLKAIAEMDGKPLPVFFETSYISDLYRNCSFIKILSQKPNTNKYFMGTQFSSYNLAHYYKSRKDKKESMAECFFRKFATEKGYLKPMPNTYVDTDITLHIDKEEGKKYVAMFHGCLGDEFVPKKSISIKELQNILNIVISEGYTPFLLGNSVDNKRFWNKINISHPSIKNYIGRLNIKDSVSLLNQCDAFISNDTGLYHVAGALEKRGLVFWGTTDFYKNRTNFSGIKRVKMIEVKSYRNYIIDFLKSL
jgi:ADP-heptose:LPS heptosyltransferase